MAKNVTFAWLYCTERRGMGDGTGTADEIPAATESESWLSCEYAYGEYFLVWIHMKSSYLQSCEYTSLRTVSSIAQASKPASEGYTSPGKSAKLIERSPP